MPQLASELSFPEGPVVLEGGDVVFTEILAGRLRRWDGSQLRLEAETGGGPNGAALAADGSLWVTQNGGMADRAVVEPHARRTPGLQRVRGDGVAVVITEAAGFRLGAPNDLAFGPDGRLYFTDPNGPATTENTNPGRIFVLDIETGATDLVAEVGPVFPNGIAFSPSGALLYTESFTRRVMVLVDGKPEALCELPERHFPDGFAVADDGTLAVATTYSGGVDLVSRDGAILDHLPVLEGGMVTNCAFAGTRLYITESRRGGLWVLDTGLRGLALHRGPAG